MHQKMSTIQHHLQQSCPRWAGTRHRVGTHNSAEGFSSRSLPTEMACTCLAAGLQRHTFLPVMSTKRSALSFSSQTGDSPILQPSLATHSILTDDMPVGKTTPVDVRPPRATAYHPNPWVPALGQRPARSPVFSLEGFYLDQQRAPSAVARSLPVQGSGTAGEACSPADPPPKPAEAGGRLGPPRRASPPTHTHRVAAPPGLLSRRAANLTKFET